MVIFGSCVEPFNANLSIDKKLVVDGLLTDQPGPHTVRLTYSAGTGVNQKFNAVPVNGAKVSIADDTGHNELLTEISLGTYQTINSSFKAEIGRKYNVHIELFKNNSLSVFESTQEMIEPSGELDNVYFEYERNPSGNRFAIYVDATKKSSTNGLMRWRWTGTYQITTEPQFHIEEGAPSPLACSGYVRGGNSGNSITKEGPCTCCECWTIEKSSYFTIYDGEQSIGNKYQKILLGYIPAIGEIFSDKYHLDVEQLSLTVNAYNFWKLAKNQKDGTGSLFQPASAKIRGNIRSLTNSNEESLGLFTVSSIVNKSIFIRKEDIPDPISYNYSTLDCRTLRANATTIKPPFW